MSQMTPAQARMIDPLVTELATGYLNPAFIYTELFPRAAVSLRASYLPAFNNDSWKRIDTRHAPGANIPEIQVSWSKNKYALADRKLNGKVPVETEEEAQNLPGINMRAESLQLVQDVISVDHEYTAAQTARNAALYGAGNKVTLAGATLWRASTSTPQADVNTAKHAIRVAIGINPNVLVLSENTFYALQQNTTLQDRFKYTSSDSITTDMLARYFQVAKVVVGSSQYIDETTAAVTDMWGNDAILAYVPQSATQNYRRPAYGYTLYLKGYPFATQTFYDVKTASYLVPWNDASDVYVTALAAGYLFVNAGA